jgi:bifunctional DNase/RNase
MMTADKDFKRLVRERAARTGESYVTARRHLLRRRQEETPLNDRLVPVDLEGVVMRQVDQLPHFWMSLREKDGGRQIRILIGPEEAAAISMGAQRVGTPRPMTHDTLKQAVDAFGGRPARIEIRHQPGDSVFTADLLVERSRVTRSTSTAGRRMPSPWLCATSPRRRCSCSTRSWRSQRPGMTDAGSRQRLTLTTPASRAEAGRRRSASSPSSS